MRVRRKEYTVMRGYTRRQAAALLAGHLAFVPGLVILLNWGYAFRDATGIPADYVPGALWARVAGWTLVLVTVAVWAYDLHCEADNRRRNKRFSI